MGKGSEVGKKMACPGASVVTDYGALPVTPQPT